MAGAAGQMVPTLPDLHRRAVAIGTGSPLGPGAQRERLRPNPASAAGGREYLFCLGRGTTVGSPTPATSPATTARSPTCRSRATIVVPVNSDIEARKAMPAPLIASALAAVIAPGNVPTGVH